ncbi:hypothetical protein QPK32_18505 [Massilia sp. YIM B02763]|uniref:hypothetical protein n=1 Tax=Massilia sp. YIM B02763 TaxID=3050130 RepID=UPI0025B6CF98|nr:hypothetical protein [Massilia sp. YIM B02763]MDN4055067.1 hypothetical protein [Massilia sp. YIM B02763]
MARNVRREHLVSRHLEVALVYKEMLGVDEAMAYLERENIPKGMAERYLHAASKPVPGGDADAAPPPQASCRRRNHVHDAIVEAALKIERKMGTASALALLRNEQVPENVILRLAAEGPRQLRLREASGDDALR